MSNILYAGKLVIKNNTGIPSNMVITNTEQTITGPKTFNNLTILNNELNIDDNTADRQKLVLKGKNATLEVLGADYVSRLRIYYTRRYTVWICIRNNSMGSALWYKKIRRYKGKLIRRYYEENFINHISINFG